MASSAFARIALAAALLGAIGAPASARGIVRVQQHDGTVQVYHNVSIRIIKGKAMIVTSPDGVGRLIIDNAACSYAGDLLRCLLDDVTLDQLGEKHDLHLDQGTLYVNFGTSDATLPLSSEAVPPKGVVLAYLTRRGTSVSLRGTVDQVTP